MSDSGIQVGDFVHRDGLGVGKVMAVDGNPSVLFWANRESGRTEKMPAELLTSLPNNGSEVLLWESPEELASWATEKPLPLVALALSFDGGTGKAADIKEKLESRVIAEGGWDGWWRKRTNPISNLPAHFDVVKTGKGNEYKLLSSVVDVPHNWTPPPKVKPAALWKKWLNGETPEPPALTRPLRPPKSVSNDLAKWPANSIDKALQQVIRGSEEFLWSGSNSSQAAEAWLEALSRASIRWIECRWSDSDNHFNEQAAELIERLSGYISPSGLPLFLLEAISAQRIREEGLRQKQQEQERQRSDYESRLEQQRQEQERQTTDHAAELEVLRQFHAAELDRERREQERLRQQVRTLDAQMSSGREESRLEIRQDMLLAVGDVLQRAYQQGKTAEDRLGNVIATLPNALREGGATTLGIVGDSVAYDPKYHYSSEVIPTGAKVCLTAPGVKVGERVILKASVSTQTEVC